MHLQSPTETCLLSRPQTGSLIVRAVVKNLALASSGLVELLVRVLENGVVDDWRRRRLLRVEGVVLGVGRADAAVRGRPDILFESAGQGETKVMSDLKRNREGALSGRQAYS